MTRRRRLRAAARGPRLAAAALAGAACALAAAPSPAVAWGRTGHRVVGALADARLTAGAAREAKRLLRGFTLADVAFWADEVKGSPDYHWAYPLHYANVPPGASHFDEGRDCRDPPGCVVGAIRRYRRVLADPKASDPARGEALRFLVHFVGDVHQPMHVAYAGDRGGNDVAVVFGGVPTNLHRVWDSLLLDDKGAFYKDIARRIARDGANWAFPDARGDPAAWADESYRVAVGFAYRVTPGAPLGAGYVARARRIVDERLLAGGVRLAALLEQALLAGRPRIAADAGSRPATGGRWGAGPAERGCGVAPDAGPSRWAVALCAILLYGWRRRSRGARRPAGGRHDPDRPAARAR